MRQKSIDKMPGLVRRYCTNTGNLRHRWVRQLAAMDLAKVAPLLVVK
jgi:hypothetical protein